MENTASGLVFPQGAQILGGSRGIVYNYMPQQIPNYVLNGENIVYVPAGFGFSVSNPCGQNFVNRQNNVYPVEQSNCILPGSVQTAPQVTGINSLAEVVGCPDAVLQTGEVTPGSAVEVRKSEKQRSKRESDDGARNRTLDEDGMSSPETEEVESHLNLFSESMLQLVSNQVQERVHQSQTGVLAYTPVANGQAVTGATQNTTRDNSFTSSAKDTSISQHVSTAAAASVSWFPEHQQQQQMQQQWQQYLQQQMQQQKLQLQQQITVVNLKLPNGQVLPGFVQNTTDNNVPASAWSVSPPGNLQGLSNFWPGSMTQVQGFPFPGLQNVQIQGGNEQVIANAHISQNLGLASNAMAVSTVPNRQPAPQFFPNMAAYGSLFKVQRLQPDATDPSKWYVIADCDNPTSVEVPDAQQSYVIDSTTPSAAVSTRDEALAESPSSSSGVRGNKKRRRQACPCPNCLQKRTSGVRKKNHICSVPGCGKVYWKSSLLKTHLLRHSGLKPYACDWEACGKRFNRTDDLQRHQRCHTGERRYECAKCQKRFMRSDHLTKHMKIHLRPKKKAVVNVKKN